MLACKTLRWCIHKRKIITHFVIIEHQKINRIFGKVACIYMCRCHATSTVYVCHGVKQNRLHLVVQDDVRCSLGARRHSLRSAAAVTVVVVVVVVVAVVVVGSSHSPCRGGDQKRGRGRYAPRRSGRRGRRIKKRLLLCLVSTASTGGVLGPLHLEGPTAGGRAEELVVVSATVVGRTGDPPGERVHLASWRVVGGGERRDWSQRRVREGAPRRRASAAKGRLEWSPRVPATQAVPTSGVL